MTHERRGPSPLLAQLGITMTPEEIQRATLAEEAQAAERRRQENLALPPNRRTPPLRPSLRALNDKLAAARLRQSIDSPASSFRAHSAYVSAIRDALAGGGAPAWERAMDELAQACLGEENPLAAATYKLVAIDSMSNLSGIPPSAAARFCRLMAAERMLASRPSLWRIPTAGDPDLIRKAQAAWRKIEELDALAGPANGD